MTAAAWESPRPERALELDPAGRAWLRSALELAHPGHAWLGELG